MAFDFQGLLLPPPAYSGGAIIASQTLTVSTAAVAGTDFDETRVKYVILDVISQPVRVRWDGTAPTASIGHKLFPDGSGSYIWPVRTFNNAQFIRDTLATGDATIFASPLSN